MSKVSVKLFNGTSKNVYFGLYNGENANDESTDIIEPGGDTTPSIDANARTIGAWIDEDTLYPSNDNPIVTGYYFKSGYNYTVTLTPTGFQIVSSRD